MAVGTFQLCPSLMQVPVFERKLEINLKDQKVLHCEGDKHTNDFERIADIRKRLKPGFRRRGVVHNILCLN